MTPDETQIIAACIEGRQEAFASLVVLYQNKVYTLIARMIRNRETALDLSQEVFIKVFRKMNSLKDNAKISSWIMQVAHNTTLDYIKKRRLESVSTDFDDNLTQQRLARFISTPASESPESIIEKFYS